MRTAGLRCGRAHGEVIATRLRVRIAEIARRCARAQALLPRNVALTSRRQRSPYHGGRAPGRPGDANGECGQSWWKVRQLPK